MAAIPYHVAEAFLDGRYERSGSFASTGKSIHSYGLQLAHWDEWEDTITFNKGIGTGAVHSRKVTGIVIDHRLDGTHNVSVTTARHIAALRSKLQRAFGENIELVPGTRLAL